MRTVTLYTDGSCSGNPGPGGWGAILMCGPFKKTLSGGDIQTTNNRMELTAVIQGLKALTEKCEVDLYSDSKYVVDSIQQRWVYGWQARGWKRNDGSPVPNAELWKALLQFLQIHTVRVHWVKGHASNEYNNMCDQLAVAETAKFKKALEDLTT